MYWYTRLELVFTRGGLLVTFYIIDHDSVQTLDNIIFWLFETLFGRVWPKNSLSFVFGLIEENSGGGSPKIFLFF